MHRLICVFRNFIFSTVEQFFISFFTALWSVLAFIFFRHRWVCRTRSSRQSVQERSLCEHCWLVQVLLQTRLCGHTQAKHMCPSQNSVASVCHSVYPYLQYATHTNTPHTLYIHFCLTVRTGDCVCTSEPKNMSSHQEPNHSSGSYEMYKTYHCQLLFHFPFHI